MNLRARRLQQIEFHNSRQPTSKAQTRSYKSARALDPGANSLGLFQHKLRISSKRLEMAEEKGVGNRDARLDRVSSMLQKHAHRLLVNEDWLMSDF